MKVKQLALYLRNLEQRLCHRRITQRFVSRGRWCEIPRLIHVCVETSSKILIMPFLCLFAPHKILRRMVKVKFTLEKAMKAQRGVEV
jgi:hypothetical protein